MQNNALKIESIQTYNENMLQTESVYIHKYFTQQLSVNMIPWYNQDREKKTMGHT